MPETSNLLPADPRPYTRQPGFNPFVRQPDDDLPRRLPDALGTAYAGCVAHWGDFFYYGLPNLRQWFKLVLEIAAREASPLLRPFVPRPLAAALSVVVAALAYPAACRRVFDEWAGDVVSPMWPSDFAERNRRFDLRSWTPVALWWRCHLARYWAESRWCDHLGNRRLRFREWVTMVPTIASQGPEPALRPVFPPGVVVPIARLFTALSYLRMSRDLSQERTARS